MHCFAIVPFGKKKTVEGVIRYYFEVQQQQQVVLKMPNKSLKVQVLTV